jgi:hypothetical protein
MLEITDIINFLEKHIGLDEIYEDSDIEKDLSCYGDDFDELMEAYAAEFHVDMSQYLWYFHTREEGAGNGLGGFFFKPPNERVPRIAVTPKMLLNFAETGRWQIQYPEHELPKRRYDLLINNILFILFLVLALIYWWLK